MKETIKQCYGRVTQARALEHQIFINPDKTIHAHLRVGKNIIYEPLLCAVKKKTATRVEPEALPFVVAMPTVKIVRVKVKQACDDEYRESLIKMGNTGARIKTSEQI